MSKTPLKIMETEILYMDMSPFQLAFFSEKPNYIILERFSSEIFDRRCRNHLGEFRIPSYLPEREQKGAAVKGLIKGKKEKKY